VPTGVPSTRRAYTAVRKIDLRAALVHIVRTHRKNMLAALAAVAALAAAIFATNVHAIVPPKDCGRMTVSHKHWHIKADQISCKRARSYAKAYIAHHTRPPHYSCHRYKGSALYAKCVNTRANPDRTIFIIKQ
jgi:hypothetical protein